MIYEPHKHLKKIIIVGSIAIVLVLLLLFVPLVFRKKDNFVSGPPENINQAWDKKIQKDFEKLEAMRKSMNATSPTQEEIQKEFDALEKQRAESGAVPPTQEQIQREFKKLEKMRNQ